MTEPAQQPAFDPHAYLAWEDQQAEKHEYVAGEVFAMVGARREHVVVAGNIYAALKHRLRGGPCQAYVADLKLRIAAADAFFYPDVMVSCDARDHAADQYLEHPVLVVEVLSDSTAAFDRGNKFAAYRLLPALREYVLIDIDARRVETFRRTPESDWLLHEYLPEHRECTFPSVGATLSFDEIFENVDPPQTPA